VHGLWEDRHDPCAAELPQRLHRAIMRSGKLIDAKAELPQAE
jgi:hypothetical protein